MFYVDDQAASQLIHHEFENENEYEVLHHNEKRSALRHNRSFIVLFCLHGSRQGSDRANQSGHAGSI